jgi:hypothetical protein
VLGGGGGVGLLGGKDCSPEAGEAEFVTTRESFPARTPLSLGVFLLMTQT